MKKTLVFVISLLCAVAGQSSWAGPLVFGPQKFVRQNGKPEKEVVMFQVANPVGTFWLQVQNGEAVQKPGAEPGVVEGQNLTSSAVISINGVEVAGPRDFNQNVFGFQKDAVLDPNNILEVEVRGAPKSFITVQVRKAEPNVPVINSQGDFFGSNMGDQVVLQWSIDERATDYILFRSTSPDGPWEERFRLDALAASTGGGKVDITPDARTMDLCYRVEALDAKGNVIRRYEPICVPKFVESQRQSFNFQRFPANSAATKTSKIQPNAPLRLASLSLLAAAPDPLIDELCLTDPQFTNFRSMTIDEIRAFLEEKGSFLKGQIKDVDGVAIDPAQELFNAAQKFQINSQVLLTTLEKEQSAVTLPKPPAIKNLKLIMGFDTEHRVVSLADKSIREQIVDAAAQFRRDFDRLSQTPPQPTAGGWQVGVPKDTLDPLTVAPESKAVATLYSYTPWVGQALGGRSGIGGNGRFCQVWEQFGFKPPEPLVLSPQNPTLTCPSGSVTFTATGGRPPYTWSTTKGVITPNGVNFETAALTPPGTNAAIQEAAYLQMGRGQRLFLPDGRVIIDTGAVARRCDDIVVTNVSSGLPCTFCGSFQELPNFNFCAEHAVSQCQNCVTFCRVSPGTITCSSLGCQPEVGAPSVGTGQEVCSFLSGSPTAGALIDVRTPDKIAQGCRPCAVEMQGRATVTVTASTTPPASVSTTVSVQ